MGRLEAGIRKWGRILLNPKMLLCFGIGWMITNGWSYLFVVIGTSYGITWMTVAGTAYMSFLWLPFTPEKIITLTIALFLLKTLFPGDQVTLQALRAELQKLRSRRAAKKKETESNHGNAANP